LRDERTRLPSPDEWEWACGAGAATLFRWGDDHPMDRLPIDSFSTEPPHRLPNAFGLRIGQDPYHAERTTNPYIVCGGDGGSMVCGAGGHFLAWLTLATSYRDADFAQWLIDEAEYVDELFVRPVIEVG
jgi:hypothetical protein